MSRLTRLDWSMIMKKENDACIQNISLEILQFTMVCYMNGYMLLIDFTKMNF